MAGGVIEIQIHEEVTYADMYRNGKNLWSFLYFTGHHSSARIVKSFSSKGEAVNIKRKADDKHEAGNFI